MAPFSCPGRSESPQSSLSALADHSPLRSHVKSILYVSYAGEGFGTALASLLWGDVSPSGKTTLTWPATEADGPTAVSEKAYPGKRGGLDNTKA